MAVIQGQVVDPQGEPVAGASIYIIEAPVSMPDIAQLTNEKGQFRLSVPAIGRYSIGIQSADWGSARKDVVVSVNDLVTMHIELSVNAI